MKLIIDIEEELVNDIKTYNLKLEQIDVVCESILNGAEISDDLRNGDVIKAMFPNTELHKESDYVSLTIQNGVYLEDRDGSWWDEPYQKGGKG